MTATVGRCYVAGAMRGLPLFGFPMFHAAEALLADAGWEVHNPARWDEDNGFEPAATGAEDQFDVEAAMRHDLEVVTTWADAVWVLPGWQESIGARLEVATAQAIGLAVFSFPSGRLVADTVETVVV